MPKHLFLHQFAENMGQSDVGFLYPGGDIRGYREEDIGQGGDFPAPAGEADG